MTALPRVALLSTGVLLGVSAFAHHGFGTFDLDSEIELSGTLTKLDWVNPHAWLYSLLKRPHACTECGRLVAYMNLRYHT